MENYNNLPTMELENMMKKISDEYEEYKPVLADILSEMDKLSQKYNDIKQIVDTRNGRTAK